MKRSATGRPDRLFNRPLSFLAAAAAIAIPTFLYASTGAGEGEAAMNWKGFAWRSFNFVVLAGFLYWLLAGKVKDFFSGRRKDIEISLAAAETTKEEAKRKFAEYDAKLTKATEEIRELAETIRMQGMAEKERIIADAERNARKIKEDARKRMDQELSTARHELRAEAVRLSVQLAEEILKKQITPSDHLGMVKDYIEKVAAEH